MIYSRKISKEEFQCFFQSEWDKNIEIGRGEVWLTIRCLVDAFKKKGVVVSWQTLSAIINKFVEEGKVEMIKTNKGVCYKPIKKFRII